FAGGRAKASGGGKAESSTATPESITCSLGGIHCTSTSSVTDCTPERAAACAGKLGSADWATTIPISSYWAITLDPSAGAKLVLPAPCPLAMITYVLFGPCPTARVIPRRQIIKIKRVLLDIVVAP